MGQGGKRVIAERDGSPGRAEPSGAGVQIIFARHGEVWNPDAIFYGRLPRFGLSAAGRRQAAAAARALAREPLAAIYASPLLRARQTARIIAAEHPTTPLRTTRAILEIRSRRQGEPTAVLDAEGWNFYEPRRHEDDETIAMIAARIRRFCRLILRRHPGQTVAAVTHGDIVAIARAIFEERPLVLASLRGDVYPATASLLRVTLGPDLDAREVRYEAPMLAG